MTDNVNPPLAPTPRQPGRRSTRRSRQNPEVLVSTLRLTHLNPWSVAVNVFLASIVLACVLVGFDFIIWQAFDSMGIFDKIVTTLTPEGPGARTLSSWLSLNKFMVIGGVLSASLTVILPLGAFFGTLVYNLMARITGGVKCSFSN